MRAPLPTSSTTLFFFFNDPATTEIYTLSLHDALPISPALKESPQLRFSNADVGFASSAYLVGAVLGALFFGWLTDRLGRKRLFFITLAVYLVATAATALSWNLASFALFRFFTGAGIGGEYTAINSSIQELVPARYRGWTDLVINGSFWIGAALGAAGSIVFLDPAA